MGQDSFAPGKQSTLSHEAGLNFTASQDFAWVAGGLGSEIVWSRVDDDSFSCNLSQGEAVRQKHRKGPAVGGKQRRQVPGVVRMGLLAGVIVATGIYAVRSLMNVKSINAAGAGQSIDLCTDKHPLWRFIKTHHALHIISLTVYPGHRPRPSKIRKKVHKSTSKRRISPSYARECIMVLAYSCIFM